MRYVFIGASTLAVASAHLLADRDQVVLITRSKHIKPLCERCVQPHSV